MKFEDLKSTYEENWQNLSIRPERAAYAASMAQRLLNGKAVYLQCEAGTTTPDGARVPWWFFGLTHYRESTFNMRTYLGNGQALDRVTTEVPAGRGPFPDFVSGALDAVKIEGFVGARDWGIARASYRVEGFNGYGYHKYGVNSPYLYGGSRLYGPPDQRGGKFPRDHFFDPTLVDPQLGTLVVLKKLLELDSSIRLDEVPQAPVAPEPDEALARGVLWVQRGLNALGADPKLAEDGRAGRATRGMVKKFQEENALPGTGLADGPTLDAIAGHLAGAPVHHEFRDLLHHLFS